MWTPPERLTSTRDGVATRATVGFASHNFFSSLGVAIPLGRGFALDEDRQGAPPVAVLMDRYWRQAFGAGPSVIGRTIAIGDTPVTIIGVAAPGFLGIDLTTEPELYLPLHTIGDVRPPLTNDFAVDGHVSGPTAGLKIIGRLHEGERVTQALARLAALDARTGHPEQFVLTPINVAALPESARPGMTRFVSLLKDDLVAASQQVKIPVAPRAGANVLRIQSHRVREAS